MKKLKNERKEQRWLITYSDLVTLLLVFFVILIAFGETKLVRTQIILSAFSGRFGFLKGGLSLNEVSEFETMGSAIEALPAEARGRRLEKKNQQATSIYNPLLKSKRVQVIENERGLVISLFTDVFFEGASAKVNLVAAQEVLEEVSLFLAQPNFKGNILIEGHTDSIPYRGTEFKDNWELSLQRAWSVLQVMRQLPTLDPLPEEKISLHGYGPTRPLESNDTPEARAYNRRVELVLERN